MAGLSSNHLADLASPQGRRGEIDGPPLLYLVAVVASPQAIHLPRPTVLAVIVA